MLAFYREAVVMPPEDMPEIKGIFLGGCVERGVGSSFRRQAHAHNYKTDPHFGWVCFRSIKRLGVWRAIPAAANSGRAETSIVIDKPGRTLWHEYAHILTPNHGHDDTWRRKMQELNQPIPKHLQRKARGKG